MIFSIIIVNWNTGELLAQCLRSLEASLTPTLAADCEIFVVDNASHDGSAAQVAHEFPHVHLLQNGENVGFARATNQAILQSSGRYVLLLNPDMWVYPQGLAALVDFMDAHPEAGVAGSRLLDADGQLQTSCYPAPTLARELWRLLHLDVLYPYAVYRMQKWSVTVPHEVDVVQGASLIVRHSILEQIGALDEDYFIYTEEVDLCTRIRQAGWRIYWVPTSQMIHYGGQSTQHVAAAMFLQLYQSKLLYFRKHHGRLAAFAYKGILYLAGLLRVLLAPLAGLVRPSKRQRQQLVSHHYRRLLLALPRM